MQDSIFQPVSSLMILTFFVWLYMYILRLTWLAKNGMPSDTIDTPEKLNSVIPDTINRPSNNLKNLFELPIIFYGLCISLYVLNKVDETFFLLAWGYVGFRVLHSLIQCSVNIIPIRFISYLISSLILWVMVFRFAVMIFI